MTKTMTAEEVAECKSIVREALGCDLESLRDLAAQAVRVPGLEEQSHADRYAICGVLMWSGEWPLGVEKLKPSRHVSALLERLQQAESERDAARKEAETLGARARFAGEGLLAVVNERDAFRQERDALLTQQQANSKLDLETATKVEVELSALRERVATLERERNRLCDERIEWLAGRDRAEARVRELEERGASLESDVKAYKSRTQHLESAIQAKADDYRASHGEDAEGPHPLVDWADRVLRGTSHPTPAHAQGVKCPACEGRGYPGEIGVGRGGQGSCPDCKGSGREPSPTPPPGLREAVGEVVPWLRALARLQVTDDVVLDLPVAGDDMATHSILAGEVRAVVAAYDATGGRYAKTPEESSDAPGRAARDEATTEDMEDAAKYRAAVGRLNDRAGQAKAAHDAWGSDPEGAVARWLLYGEGGAPAPSETLDKARVVEVLSQCLAAIKPGAESDTVTGWECAILKVALDLGLTLDTPPSGPGGGEAKSADYFWPKFHAAQRRRVFFGSGPVAPTPTPEVPPLRSGPCNNTRQPDMHSCVLPYAHKGACDFQPEPQPTAPAVIWQTDGIRVSGSGDAYVEVSGGSWLYLNDDRFQALARALAEAKREVAEARKATEDAMRESAHRYEVEIPEAMKKAAESMRERAATAAKTARHRVLVTDESFGVYAMACEDIEISIRRLPLE